MTRSWPVVDGEAELEAVLARLDETAGAEQMAGRRRVGTEHTKNARRSTEGVHQNAQARKKRGNEAADRHNAAAQQQGRARRRRQTLSDIEARLKNAPPAVRDRLWAAKTAAEQIAIIRQYLAGKSGYDLRAALADQGLDNAVLLAHLADHHLVSDEDEGEALPYHTEHAAGMVGEQMYRTPDVNLRQAQRDLINAIRARDRAEGLHDLALEDLLRDGNPQNIAIEQRTGQALKAAEARVAAARSALQRAMVVPRATRIQRRLGGLLRR